MMTIDDEGGGGVLANDDVITEIKILSKFLGFYKEFFKIFLQFSKIFLQHFFKKFTDSEQNFSSEFKQN